MPLDQTLPPILTSWAPFWLSESTLRVLWAQTGPGTPKTSKKNDFELHFGPHFDPKGDQKLHMFWTFFLDPLRRGFWEHRASISRAFGHQFGYFLGPEGKSENCALVEARTILTGLERVTFTTFLRIQTRPLERVPAEMISKRFRAHFEMPFCNFWPQINIQF